MRWRPLCLFLALFLSACARPDTLPPQIGLVEPAGSGVAPGRNIQAEGYAFDPSGVVGVWVNGQPVLPEGEQGKKLARFRFRLQAPVSGQVEVRLQAQDGAGNRGERVIPLVLDAAPPRIRVERVEREGGLYRVFGQAEDNVGVARMVLRVGERYTPLSLPQGPSVPFAVEAPAGASLIAVDAAGNRTVRRIP
ncbi:hypothetical protein YIM1640_01280 [Thermus oshimai]|jgi:hypothetical protein|uniref:hypothetical protein n=1 Tax=Thermus oshimai TaxID=56957 RepID=UPI00035E618C|nr:hypothetical protein [Thermus oshimai]